MTAPPTAAEKAAGDIKTVNGKTHHWCPMHEAWGIHKPTDCKGSGWVPKGGSAPTLQQLQAAMESEHPMEGADGGHSTDDTDE